MTILQRSVDHLGSVHETYWEHGRQALGIAVRLAGATLAVIVHALVPGWFTHTASDIAEDIVRERRARERRAAGLPNSPEPRPRRSSE